MRRASRNRAELLMKAAEVVAERGFENTRFTDVAGRTGASISTLQYLFGNREDLVVQALRARTAHLLAEARLAAEAIPDPIVRLRWVAGHLAATDGSPEAARAEWMLWVEYWRTALRDDELAVESIDTYEGWAGLVRDAIQAAVDAGALPAPADIDAVAQGACALADGLGIQIALGRPGMTWERAAGITRGWLATTLSCPPLADTHS
ncbi:TetR family transcriptional regulator C-terminal domain-containing protein [Actinoplanes sp. G11-F43]|uniref:TetR family transcriptional regulator C-terminal domain-containing protein n=1 Tax=Actinoplanes sp. G11-F43 TaxID=3424130 RepID=UPI003D359381